MMRRVLLYGIPLVTLVGLVALLFAGMQDRDHSLPSPLIGKQPPALPEPPAGGADALASAREQLHLINFWASWCQPCLVEHPRLMALSREGVPIVGVNYKDRPQAAERWLQRHGDPFSIVLRDEAGGHAIDWGVYGVPETYVIGADGRVLRKHVGEIDAEFEREVLQAMRDQQEAS